MTTSAPTYEFRQARFWGSRLVRCSLDESRLTVDVEGKPPLRVPYKDITAVHLSNRAHGRNEAAMQVRDFRCRVSAGSHVVEVTNRSDPGVGHAYQYQNRAFNQFVHELHDRLLPFKERVQFRTGHRLYFVLAAATSAMAAIVAPFRLASYEDHLAFGIAVYLSAVIGLVLAAARLRPRSYAPTNIPDTLLPANEDHQGVMA